MVPRVAMIKAILTLFVATCLTSPTLAQDRPPCAPEVTLRRATVAYQNTPGIWFAMPVARCMLEDLTELPILRDRVRLLEERLRLSDVQVQDLTQAGTLAVAEIDAAQTAAAHAIAEHDNLEREMHAWYRSPWLWLVVGFGAALVSTTTVFVLTR